MRTLQLQSEWWRHQKTQSRLKEKILTCSGINAVPFSKLKQSAFYDFLGLLDELRILALVISCLNRLIAGTTFTKTTRIWYS